MKALKKFFKNNLFVIFLIFILTSIAYGQTLKMYFLIDDNALIYKLQHINEYTGFWGKGIIGEGPYRHIVDQFVLFYPIFGVNTAPYFMVGVLLYFFAGLALYIFVNFLTRNKLIALGASAIFASGYVGSESMFGIVNSWQTTRGIIMALVTFFLFYHYIKSKNIIFYLLSVTLFFFSLDTVYIRAHGLVFAILFFDILFWPVLLKVSSIVQFIVRQTPFLLIHYYVYFRATAYVKSLGIFDFLHDIFVDGNFLIATIPLQNLGNLFIPDMLTSYVNKIISDSVVLPNELSIGSILAGIFILFLSIYILSRSYKSERFLNKVLIFSLIFSVANFMVFWARETNHTLWTTHRYFLYSFVGVSLFWATAFYLISKNLRFKNALKVLTFTVIIVYLFLGINYQKEFNERRSFPAQKFFSSFKKSMPSIPKEAVIYFNLMNDRRIQGEFGSFFGGMFSEAGNLAILGDVDDYTSDFLVTYDINEVKRFLGEGKTSLDKVFTFYYGDEGLIDTSQITRELLITSKEITLDTQQFSSSTSFRTSGGVFTTSTHFEESGEFTTGENPVVTISVPDNTPSLVPSVLSFSMSVSPNITPLPYQTKGQSFDIDSKEKNKIFSYLLSQNNFRKTAVGTSASFWKEQEAKLALDGRLETAWRGHRGYWDDIDRNITRNIEYFQVDLRHIATVGQIMWVSAQRPLVPTHYKILTSTDGKEWQLVKEVTGGNVLPEGTVIFDSFKPTPARYLKMEILATYGNDGPEIKEFEVLESRFAELDRKVVEKVRQAPFAEIETLSDFNNAWAFVQQNASLRFYYQSSADGKQDETRYVDIPVVIDGKLHQYSIDLPATGINWTQFTIGGFNFPAEIKISSPSIIYKTIQK